MGRAQATGDGNELLGAPKCVRILLRHPDPPPRWRDNIRKKCDSLSVDDYSMETEPTTQQLLERTKTNIDVILKAMTDEQPLGYTFVNWEVEEKHKSKLPGLLLGLALGGLGGEMLFGGTLLSKSESVISGKFGILVITSHEAILGYCTAPLLSADGRICDAHVEFLRQRLESHDLSRKTFHLPSTVFDMERVEARFLKLMGYPARCSDLEVGVLISASESLLFRTSELWVNDAPYETLRLPAIASVIEQLDMMPTAEAFVAKLNRGKNPLSEERINEIVSNEVYVRMVLSAIVAHPNRHGLLRNLSCIGEPLRALLVGKIRNSAASCVRLIVFAIFCFAASMVCLVTAQMTWDDHGFTGALFLMGALLGAALCIVMAVDLRRAWPYRKLLQSESVISAPHIRSRGTMAQDSRQIVGEVCVKCGKKVITVMDATYCGRCFCPVHKECAIAITDDPKLCAECGADAGAQERYRPRHQDAIQKTAPQAASR
jgi:hypothetical protein